MIGATLNLNFDFHRLNRRMVLCGCTWWLANRLLARGRGLECGSGFGNALNAGAGIYCNFEGMENYTAQKEML